MTIFDTIKTDNRDEIIAIPFYGWIKNPIETIIRTLMGTGKYARWINKYPFLAAFPVNDPNRFFSLTMQYTLNSFRKALIESGTKNGIEENQIEADFSEMLARADPSLPCITVMELIIKKLLAEDFVKAIYIYEPAMYDTIKKYLAQTFTENINRIYIVESNIKSIIESNDPKFTTIYAEDTEMFMDVLQSYDNETKKKYMSNTYYILPAKSSLTENAKHLSAEMGILPTDSDIFKYQKYLNGTLAQFQSMIDYLQLKAINLK